MRMPVYVHRPERWTENDRVVIVMHGTNRDADRYRDEWKAHADDHNLLLVVPEFSRAKFPSRGTYNFGNVGDDKGQPNPSESWTFGSSIAFSPKRGRAAAPGAIATASSAIRQVRSSSNAT
jgi:hypothetical protein